MYYDVVVTTTAQESALDCLLSWVSPEPNSGCWLWLGSLDQDGYGLININKLLRRAHRAFYELLKGEIPSGLQLDHLCRVRCCVNPDHLEPVTCGENVRRGLNVGPNSPGAAFHKSKTHCPHGHPYDEENTRIFRGGRYCKECIRIAGNLRWERIRLENKGKSIPPREKTTCLRGHPFDESNTYWHRGRRSCLACRSKARAEYNARKSAGLVAE